MTVLRTNEIRYAFATNTADLATNTTLGTATRFDFTAITLTIPETSSRTFLSVRLRLSFRDRFTVANELTGIRMGIKLGAVAVDDLDRSWVLANTGDHTYNEWERDVTDYFNANFGAGATQTCQAGIAVSSTAASNIGGSITACLIICYQYDDSVGTTRVKTIPIPIQSQSTTLTNVQQEVGTDGTNPAPANQIPALDTYLREASKTYCQAFLESRANDESASTADITPFIQIDATAEVARGLIGQALQTTMPWMDILLYDTGTFATNVAHAFKARADVTARMCFFGAFLWVTYTYDTSTTTILTNIAIVPVSQAHDDSTGMVIAESATSNVAADAQKLIAELIVNEPGEPSTDAINILQSCVFWDFNSTSSVVGLPKVKAGAQVDRQYTNVIAAGGEHPIIHRVDHSSGWTLNQGKNRLVFSLYDTVINTRHNLDHAYALIVYTSGVPANGCSAATRIASFVVSHEPSAIATIMDVAAASQRAANLGSFWFLLSVQMEGRVFGNGGSFRPQLGLALGAGEFDATGFIYLVNPGATLAENGSWWFAFPFREAVNRHSLTAGMIDVTTRRRNLMTVITTGFLAHWSQVVTFNNVSYTVAGTVTVGGSPVANGKTVLIFARDSAGATEYITSTTTTGGTGAFTAQVPDKWRTYFCTYKDGATLGRSDDLAPLNTFNITIASGSGDVTPPTDSVTSPTPGQLPGIGGGFSADYNLAKDTPIIYNAVDAASAVGFVVIFAKFSDRVAAEAIYIGTGTNPGFQRPYALYSSVTGSGAAGVGFTFNIRRDDGWPKGVSVVFTARVMDAKGNLL